MTSLRAVLVFGALAACSRGHGSEITGAAVADETQCGAGLTPLGARCCRPEARAGTCSSGVSVTARRVPLPATTLLLGPSDWEAEGRVPPRQVTVGRFELDAFEATVAELDAFYTKQPFAGADGARAGSGLARSDAARYCASKGGRLPSEDEWIAAAAGTAPRRYPWGDTGAVCRRAAWGLSAGPCSTRGTGPDTVGAHPDGDSPDGLHDLAGNVAEWVQGEGPSGVARGGSWRTALATELRVWSRLELPAEAHDDRVGVRCAYDAVTPRGR